jgi:hypothetical protein
MYTHPKPKGISPKGTSHLLLADIQTSAFGRVGKRRPLGFTTLADYVSVSPIWFDSVDDLRLKFKSLRPKPKKKKGKKDEAWDTSQANKAFASGDQGLQRGEFEHGRFEIIPPSYCQIYLIAIQDALSSSSKFG